MVGGQELFSLNQQLWFREWLEPWKLATSLELEELLHREIWWSQFHLYLVSLNLVRIFK